MFGTVLENVVIDEGDRDLRGPLDPRPDTGKVRAALLCVQVLSTMCSCETCTCAFYPAAFTVLAPLLGAVNEMMQIWNARAAFADSIARFLFSITKFWLIKRIQN